MIKCEIILNGYVYDATNDLVNWDDVEMKWKRNDFDGVVRSFTTKFEFAGSTYSLLVSEFIRNMLNASASIVFYTRNNSWLWNERFRCALDFSTFSYNGNTCEINAIDDTLAAKIKANRSTKYEYLVDEIKDDKELDYDRLNVIGSAKWMTVLPEQGYYYSTDANNYATIGFYVIESEVLKRSLYIQDCPTLENALYFEDIVSRGYLIENVSSVSIRVKLKLGLRFLLNYEPDPYGSGIWFVIQVGKYTYDGNTHNFKMSFNESTKIKSGDILSIDKEIDIPSGSVLCAFLQLDHIEGTITVEQVTPLSIEYIYRYDTVRLPVISPVSLLNRLLKSISNNEGITGEIVNPTYALQRTFILPSESIRGISGEKIYTSYKDFQEWMFTVFGFVPVISDNKVSFVHMDTLFPDKQIKTLENVSEFELSLDAGMVYTSVRVGYNKQDYDSVNGRDEFRFTTEYTTGTKLTDSSLELISPYRADAYGVEFLAQTRGEDTTDNSSDKDVFFIMAQSTDESVLHLERKQTISGVLSPSTMFNNLYAAPYMITAHYNYLRTLGEKLVFTSSDGNSDVKINSFALNADLELPNTSLFLPARATFITDDSSIPDDLSGYISFVHQGKQYKGYVSEITLNIGRKESVKYELIVKSIEDA